MKGTTHLEDPGPGSVLHRIGVGEDAKQTVLGTGARQPLGIAVSETLLGIGGELVVEAARLVIPWGPLTCSRHLPALFFAQGTLENPEK